MVRLVRSRAISMAAAVFLGVASLIVSCSGASLTADLHMENLSFIEIGDFGSMRTLDPLVPFFGTRKLAKHANVIGASSTGDRLLVLTQSPLKQGSVPLTFDEIDITMLDGMVETRIRAKVYAMLPSTDTELSPDGQSLAFCGQFATPNFLTAPELSRADYGLHLLKSSGEISTLVVTTRRETPRSIGWSKDGRTIVYDHEGSVLFYHLDRGASTLLTNGTEPVWSPDGEWIAYRRPDGGAGLIHPDGSGRRDILEGVMLGRGLRWSPDSRYLLYTDQSSGSIRVLELMTGRTATITTPIDGSTETRLRWVRGMPH